MAWAIAYAATVIALAWVAPKFYGIMVQASMIEQQLRDQKWLLDKQVKDDVSGLGKHAGDYL